MDFRIPGKSDAIDEDGAVEKIRTGVPVPDALIHNIQTVALRCTELQAGEAA